MHTRPRLLADVSKQQHGEDWWCHSCDSSLLDIKIWEYEKKIGMRYMSFKMSIICILILKFKCTSKLNTVKMIFQSK